MKFKDKTKTAATYGLTFFVYAQFYFHNMMRIGFKSLTVRLIVNLVF